MSDKEVTSGHKDIDVLLGKIFNVGSLVSAGRRDTEEIEKAVQAFISGEPFKVELLKPATFADFLKLEKPTQGVFNQLVSEKNDCWQFFNEIEGACLLNGEATAKARPFIDGLWADEVSSREPFKPPAGWRYLPVEEAIEAWEKVFGSSIRTNGLVDKAKSFNPWQCGEGIAVCPSLLFLLREFEIAKELGISNKIDPMGTGQDSLTAYAKIVETFLALLGKEYKKATGYPFKNWRVGKLSAQHLQLTSAGRITWQQLAETFSGSDLVAAPANSGSTYAGHSVRRSRVGIVLNRGLPQDILMVGGTLVVQPERFTRYEDLGVDVPGNQYSVEAVGSFPPSLYFYWYDGTLHCNWHFAGNAYSDFGSASLCLGQ